MVSWLSVLLLLLLSSINLSDHLPEQLEALTIKRSLEELLSFLPDVKNPSCKLQTPAFFWCCSESSLPTSSFCSSTTSTIQSAPHNLAYQFCLQRNAGECRPLTLMSQKYPASSRDLGRDLYLLQVLMYSWKVCGSLCFFFLQMSSARFTSLATLTSSAPSPPPRGTLKETDKEETEDWRRRRRDRVYQECLHPQLRLHLLKDHPEVLMSRN